MHVRTDAAGTSSPEPLTILGVVGMALRAARFASVLRGRSFPTQNILSEGDRLEVIRVEARPHAAAVV